MNRINLFTKAKIAAEKLHLQYPQDSSIVSVINQLVFLIEIESGVRSDYERLDDIIIGVLALKEIDQLDQVLAEQLYSVVEEVDYMKIESRANKKLNNQTK